VVGTTGSADIVGSTEVAGSGDVVELSSVMAGLAILGGSVVSTDVEEARSSLALEGQSVRPSRAAASALAPKDLTRALSVLADSDLQAPHAAVSLMGSGDLGEASVVMADSVIRVFQVVLIPAAVSAAAHAWPLDRPEDAEGASGVLNLDRIPLSASSVGLRGTAREDPTGGLGGMGAIGGAIFDGSPRYGSHAFC